MMSNQQQAKKKKSDGTITIAVEVAGKTETLKVGLKSTIGEALKTIEKEFKIKKGKQVFTVSTKEAMEKKTLKEKKEEIKMKSKANVKEGEDDGKIKRLRVGGYCPNTSKGRNSQWDNATEQFEDSFKKVCEDFKKKKDGKGVLPVFLAPEWSFRMPNKTVRKVERHQFFSQKELGLIIEKLKAITEPYKDVLVVSGSILWAMKDPAQKKKGKKDFPVYNTTVVLCGGKIVHVYHKQFWGLDTKEVKRKFFAFNADSVLKGLKTMKTKNVNDKGKVIAKAVVSNTFEHAGLTFGIEICHDHNVGALAENCGGKEIDVHILVSSGATLYGPHVAARIGGIALSTDGAAPNLADLKNNCFGWAKVQNLNWSDDNGTHKNKTFISEQKEQKKNPTKLPKCSWVYNDLIEFD